jgi:hypothetical protein
MFDNTEQPNNSIPDDYAGVNDEQRIVEEIDSLPELTSDSNVLCFEEHKNKLMARIAKVENESVKDFLLTRFYKKVKKTGIKRKSLQNEMAAFSPFDSGPEEKIEPKALFPELVDIIAGTDTSGNDIASYLICDSTGQLSVQDTAVIGGQKVCPSESEYIPWQLPREDEVIKYYHSDNDVVLFEDIMSFFKNIVSEMPDVRLYILIAAWIMLSYLSDRVQYLPCLWFYAVFERGKSRTGKAITYMAYRGIHVESLRESYILRMANNYGATIFFDVIDLWKRAERSGSEDILMSRFEKGIKSPRIAHPERGAFRDTVYYNCFGPTVIATNEELGDGLATRGIQINMPSTARTFNEDITPEKLLPFKERLIAFRARHLHDQLPDVPKPVAKRLGDITRALLQVLRLVRPDLEPDLNNLICEIEQDKKNAVFETPEAKIVEAVVALYKADPKMEHIIVNAAADWVRRNYPDYNSCTNKSVGSKLKALGFRPTKREPGTGRSRYIFDTKLLRTLEAQYIVNISDDEPENGGSQSSHKPEM